MKRNTGLIPNELYQLLRNYRLSYIFRVIRTICSSLRRKFSSRFNRAEREKEGERYSTIKSGIANDSPPQIDFVFVMEFAVRESISKYLECARNINPTVIYEVKSLLRRALRTRSARGGNVRVLIMHLSPEATVGTSRPFNLAIIQRLLLVRLVRYSIAGNVARCVSSERN